MLHLGFERTPAPGRNKRNTWSSRVQVIGNLNCTPRARNIPKRKGGGGETRTKGAREERTAGSHKITHTHASHVGADVNKKLG